MHPEKCCITSTSKRKVGMNRDWDDPGREMTSWLWFGGCSVVENELSFKALQTNTVWVIIAHFLLFVLNNIQLKAHCLLFGWFRLPSLAQQANKMITYAFILGGIRPCRMTCTPRKWFGKVSSVYQGIWKVLMTCALPRICRARANASNSFSFNSMLTMVALRG